MLSALYRWYRGEPDQPYVRPWGLAVPVLVLIVSLPLLRPLRHPEPTNMSDNELARMATIQAIVEHQTLCIDHSSLRPSPDMLIRIRPQPDRRGDYTYSKQPPVLAAILAAPYWVMHRFGLTFDKNMAGTCYVLTLLGAALPVAMAAGLVYRLGRLFELRRQWRVLLSFAAIFGSGLLSYATVINTHAPAAALILGTCGALFHAGMARSRSHAHSWLVLAGLSAGLAAMIDFSALAFLLMLSLVILAMRWPIASRVGGVAWYVFGALPPLALHATLMLPITADLRPGFLHTELLVISAPASQPTTSPDEDEEDETPSLFVRAVTRTADGLVGSHGLLTHFPVLLLGVAGIPVVLRRNWPAATKTMAAVSLIGAVLIIGAYVLLAPRWDLPMFSVRWFIPFLPLLIFWSGVWLRRKHHPVVWVVAGVLLFFSVLVTLIGAAR